MKALITGVSGFIGRELARLLVESDWEVIGTSRHTTTIQGVEWHHWDAAQQPDSSLLAGVDVIFHLAGKAHAIAESRQNNDEYDTINYGGTERLLRAAHREKVARIVYFSSVKAVGDAAGIMDASTDLPAETPYGRSKRKAEQLLLASNLIAEPVIVRPSMVYGATDKGNLPRMIRATKRGLFPPLPHTDNRRSMVHVNDVARAALLLATHPATSHHIYIITDGKDYAIHQIQQWIYQALEKQIPNWTLPLPLLKLAATIGESIGNISGRNFPLNNATLDKLIGDARYSSEPLQNLGFTAHHSLQPSMAEIVQFVTNKQGTP
ncbi:MAG: NAD-dependent epimerase/dehydratase family protein [Mariprofundales bacterium]